MRGDVPKGTIMHINVTYVRDTLTGQTEEVFSHTIDLGPRTVAEYLTADIVGDMLVDYLRGAGFPVGARTRIAARVRRVWEMSSTTWTSVGSVDELRGDYWDAILVRDLI